MHQVRNERVCDHFKQQQECTLTGNTAAEDSAPSKVKKSKKPMEELNEDMPTTNAVTIANGDADATKKTKKDKKNTERSAEETEETEEAATVPQAMDSDQLSSDDDQDSEIDDQTEALLQGFQSDGDEEDALNEDGVQPGQKILARKELSKAQEKTLKKIASSNDSEKPGVVYIGRIPHGFFENEMKSYFSQFGNILKLRLSRNKKTGASKHYAWIQFESATVADIVAKTMDNYLMFGHILKVKLVPDEQVPEDLFKGANKRFKKVPWNKIVGRKLEQGLPEKGWNARIEREQKRRDDKMAKMKAIGYEFEAPKIKATSDIATKEKPLPILPTGTTEQPLAIEPPPATEEVEVK